REAFCNDLDRLLFGNHAIPPLFGVIHSARGTTIELLLFVLLSITYSASSSPVASDFSRSGLTRASASSTRTTPVPRLTISTRRQRLSLLIGRHSSMRIRSPS